MNATRIPGQMWGWLCIGSLGLAMYALGKILDANVMLWDRVSYVPESPFADSPPHPPEAVEEPDVDLEPEEATNE